MGPTSDSDREQLLAELEKGRSELRASYQGLPDEQMTRSEAVGEWSVKDVLSHVASWDEVMLADLERIARGDTPALASVDLESANYDAANAVIMSQRRDLPLNQVVRGLDADRAEVVAAVGRLPVAALAEGQFGRLLIQITAAHDLEHAASILEWRRRERLYRVG
jgi:hypothetical protein